MDTQFLTNCFLLSFYFPFAERRLLECKVLYPQIPTRFLRRVCIPCPECIPESFKKRLLHRSKDETCISLPLSRLARTDRSNRTLTAVQVTSGASTGGVGVMHGAEAQAESY